MTFSDEDKLKALAIVNIFETSRPFGDYSACVVLNDGAGVSYGINQFTHRSGSLASVVETYLYSGGMIGGDILRANLPLLRQHSALAVSKLAADERFKAALRAAAATPEMKDAQKAVAFELYLRPALEICAMRGFTQPLSLAVVYDSVTHGSWDRISRLISKADEKAWITAYVRKRHLWLTNIPRLRPTNYRTKFLLDQLAIGNWDLRLPMNVHGVRLTQVGSEPGAIATGQRARSAEPAIQTKDVLDSANKTISAVAEKFDRVDGIVTTVTSRTDAVKSLWTTVAGTLWQMVWAIFGFLAGLPPEVWIVVAVIAASLMLLYLYRQIVLGRIREETSLKGTKTIA